MSRHNSDIPGLRLIIVVIGLLLVWVACLAITRPVQVSESPPAHDVKWPDMRVDINSAETAELSLLPGIGPALAQRIVEDRDAHGSFENLSELDRVPGIGQSVIDRIAPFAVVEPVELPAAASP